MYVKQAIAVPTQLDGAYGNFRLLFPVVNRFAQGPEFSAIEVVQESSAAAIQGQQGNADFRVSSDSVRSVAANSPGIQSQANQKHVNQYHIGEQEQVCRGRSNGTNARKQEISEEAEAKSSRINTFCQASAEGACFNHPSHTYCRPEETETAEYGAAENIFVAVVKNASQDLCKRTAE